MLHSSRFSRLSVGRQVSQNREGVKQPLPWLTPVAPQPCFHLKEEREYKLRNIIQALPLLFQPLILGGIGALVVKADIGRYVEKAIANLKKN